MTSEQLTEGLQLQQKMRSLGLRESLGQILVRKGYLSRDQISKILRTQGRRAEFDLPGFEILEKLGAGAMGAVYKARQLSMDRFVAIKVLSESLNEHREGRERFLREGRLGARLNHPNIVRAIDAGVHSNRYFLVMEFIEGMTLDERLSNAGPIDVDFAIDLWIQIAEALAHADSLGMIHRDIKPANIIIDSSSRAKLTDLGLARPIEAEGTPLTLDGISLGTPYYISPEQAKGKRDLDIRTDLYCLAATFYHALTGKPVFDAGSAPAIVVQHINEDPVPPDYVRGGLPPELCKLLLRCLEKEPVNRPSGPKELIATLESIREARTPPAPEEPPPKTTEEPKRSRRRRALGRRSGLHRRSNARLPRRSRSRRGKRSSDD